ncbi:MAG TPA: hypothetical protein ENN69_01695, partial [Spirochaetia bacterium]|nr:hypothetical protein [Spirochaetia bacterium]
MLVFKIAWRNLLRHKGKSFVVGTILFLGALIMTLGNATSIGMQRGIEENMVRSFTGHIVLVSDEETKENVLFTPMGKPLKILKKYPQIEAVLKKQTFVKDFLPMTRGAVGILGSDMGFMLTFGCNFDDFQRVFGEPITPVEGELLSNGDHGLLVNTEGRKLLYRQHGFWLVPEGADPVPKSLTDDAREEGNSLLVRRELALEGFGEENATNIIVPVKGIMRFKSLNTSMQEVSIMDIESFRKAFGYFTARDVVEEIPVEDKKLLEADEDDFFGEGDIFSSGSTDANVAELEKKLTTQTVVRQEIDYDTAAFNYVSVLLEPGESLSGAIQKLNAAFAEENLPVKVLSWKQASGQVAQMAD